MAFILIILQIIAAIPTIISIVQKIIELIHGLKGAEQRAAKAQLHGILRRHVLHPNAEKCHAELQQLHDDLKGKYGC